MEEKNFNVVTRHRIYNIGSWLGVIVAVIGYFLEGAPRQILPWVGLGIVILAVIFRFTMIKCPYCGHPLTQSKSLPDRCPQCDKELK